MATISSVVQAAEQNSARGRVPYLVQHEIDFADITVDPSAGDVVQVMTIPAGTMILTAGFEVTETPTVANGTDAVVTLGTDTDADEYVTAFDFDAATAGDYAPMAAAATVEVVGTENTLDLTFSATNADGISAGKVRVFAWLMDVSDMGEMTADEVSRDQLA